MIRRLLFIRVLLLLPAAANAGRTVKKVLLGIALLLALDAAAVTVDNDDSCDIAVMPAATLLLPYFEVDLDDINGETTLFTITNVTHVDRIAHVTLWTDYAYPVLSFPIYLTGYDVQSINLFDIIGRGVIAPPVGTGWNVRLRGKYSRINPAVDLRSCNFLPGNLDPIYVERMQDAFTDGVVDDIGNILPGCQGIGGTHERAVGYATVDVVGTCSTAYPLDRDYWTELIRYDNVLIGDYQQLNRTDNSAQGGPMVHIRAVPEGGTPEQRASLFQYDAEFDRTFYSQYQPAATPRLDGRQPLPAQFATRWIQGGSSAYETSFKIWREGVAGDDAACAAYAGNATLDIGELVVFDENENATANAALDSRLPATSRTSVAGTNVYPQLSGPTSGWMYLNLDRPGDDYASQNWVISSMRALGRFSTDTDAIALGNGCSVPIRPSEVSRVAGAAIRPAANGNGNDDDEVSTQNDDSCDVAAMPAATLLLPHFEVDVDDQQGTTTLVTVTNVSAQDRIARVTLWTDLAFPVLSFNLFLTGYDVQSINLYDVIERGVIASTSTPRGPYSEPNRDISLRSCDRLPGVLDPAVIARMQDAFLVGISDQCDEIGLIHDNAVGYATIDLVRNCGTHGPSEAEYWSDDLAYDNVLIGDYQHVHLADNAARSGELVHIRAIPEGGGDDAPFARTFYSRHQRPSSPKRDGRQPLPALFAARWIDGGGSAFSTLLEIWRETTAGPGAACARHHENVTTAVDMVVFDEAENAWGDLPQCRCAFDPPQVELPASALVHIGDDRFFPQPTNGAIGGWVYMNLDASAADTAAHQNWVTTAMTAEGRFSVSAHAAALGNGCSAPVQASVVTTGNAVIGPAPNVNPR